MAYSPTVNDQSGQILAQGINAGAANIDAALKGIMGKREEAKSAIATMDMLASLNPEALPKDAAGNVDAKFLEKFYAAPLASQQQTLGLITSKLLITPEDQARIGLQNAQTGLVNEQAGQYKQAAQQDAQGAAAYQGHRKTLSKWSSLVNPGANPKAPFAGPEMPADPITGQPPVPDVLPPLPPL
jgi:hypothetical protein